METSPLICSSNQWTGFYMIGPSVMKELKINCNTILEKNILAIKKEYGSGLKCTRTLFRNALTSSSVIKTLFDDILQIQVVLKDLNHFDPNIIEIYWYYQNP